MRLTSTAFTHGGPIPPKYTCDGDDVSPPLAWQDVPEAVASLALIMDDPDAPAGTWDHWVVYDLPPDIESLPEGAEVSSLGGRQGKNSWGTEGYGGPCPPGGTHRYFFRLYALDRVLGESAGETKPSLLRAMEGHVLAQAELMGTYSRVGR